MPTTLRKRLTISGICDSTCLKKLKELLSQDFTLDFHESIPSHMAFKGSLSSPDLSRDVHLEIFTNERCEIKASPEIASDFPIACSKVEAALKEAVDIVSRGNSIRAMRAGRILEYLRDLSTPHEVNRMVIVTLCDIVLDLLITEKLAKFTTRRHDLEHESIGAKIGMLKQRIPVYKEQAMRDIRNLRNKVAHGGATTALTEAEFAKNATEDIFDTF